MFVNIKSLTRWNANRCYSLRTTYLIFETFQNLIPTASLIFTTAKLFHQVIWERTEHNVTFRIHNGSWHETLNLPYVSSCKMFTFCDVLHEQDKKHKQTLESVLTSAVFSLGADLKQNTLSGKFMDNFWWCSVAHITWSIAISHQHIQITPECIIF